VDKVSGQSSDNKISVAQVQPGITYQFSHKVSEADTAIAHNSGSVPVLATPKVVALCEYACCEAISSYLQEDYTTVGSHVDINHLAPSSVGDDVEIEVQVSKVDGRKFVFTVSVSDHKGTAAFGTMTRVMVNRDSFLSRL
jgi:predicted thioesterase